MFDCRGLKTSRFGKWAHWMKMLATKHDHLCSVPGPHSEDRTESRKEPSVLHMHSVACTHAHAHTDFSLKKNFYFDVHNDCILSVVLDISHSTSVEWTL